MVVCYWEAVTAEKLLKIQYFCVICRCCSVRCHLGGITGRGTDCEITKTSSFLKTRGASCLSQKDHVFVTCLRFTKCDPTSVPVQPQWNTQPPLWFCCNNKQQFTFLLLFFFFLQGLIFSVAPEIRHVHLNIFTKHLIQVFRKILTFDSQVDSDTQVCCYVRWTSI